MTSTTPAVSVVLPTYDRADVLGRAIESVLAQTYTDFELIVVDDGSTDDTGGVVRAFDDPRLTFLEHETNRGAAAARNTGIDEAVGAFIAFQDSDDVWDLMKLQKQMAVFADAPRDVGVVYTGFWDCDGTDRVYRPGPGVEPKEGDVHESFLRQNFVTTQAAVVRAECLSAVGGFDERLPRFQDWELWIRLSLEYEFRYVDEPLVVAHDRPDSISNDIDALVEARRIILSKHGDEFDRTQLGEQLFRLGHASLRARRRQHGQQYLLQAIKTDPRPFYASCLVLSLFGATAYNRLYRFVRGIDG